MALAPPPPPAKPALLPPRPHRPTTRLASPSFMKVTVKRMPRPPKGVPPAQLLDAPPPPPASVTLSCAPPVGVLNDENERNPREAVVSAKGTRLMSSTSPAAPARQAAVAPKPLAVLTLDSPIEPDNHDWPPPPPEPIVSVAAPPPPPAIPPPPPPPEIAPLAAARKEPPSAQLEALAACTAPALSAQTPPEPPAPAPPPMP